ncbi:MAG: hypothetical protein WC100_21750 [Sterolibacterium sp.]
MFHTFSEAEFPISTRLADPGIQLWRWVEFALHIPYFLVDFRVSMKEGSWGRHLIFSDVNEVIQLNALDKTHFRIQSVCVLFPSYMTGSRTYELVEIREVWSNRDSHHDLLFLTKCDRKLRSYEYSDEASESEMECVLRVATDGSDPQNH